jgi:hypothetical protein
MHILEGPFFGRLVIHFIGIQANKDHLFEHMTIDLVLLGVVENGALELAK